MVVVQAEDGGEVGHERVRLPPAVLEPSAEGAHGVAPKDARQAAHERRLTAPGVGGDADKYNLRVILLEGDAAHTQKKTNMGRGEAYSLACLKSFT